jgi:hypothetical protein
MNQISARRPPPCPWGSTQSALLFLIGGGAGNVAPKLARWLARNPAAQADTSGVEQLIKRRLDRLVQTIELVSGKSPLPEAQAHLLQLLATGLGLTERGLTVRPP